MLILAGLAATEIAISYVGSIKGFDITSDDIRVGAHHNVDDLENFRKSCDYYYDDKKSSSCQCLAERSKLELSWFDMSMMAAEYTNRHTDILRLWKGYADSFVIGKADPSEIDRFKAEATSRQSAVKAACKL